MKIGEGHSGTHGHHGNAHAPEHGPPAAKPPHKGHGGHKKHKKLPDAIKDAVKDGADAPPKRRPPKSLDIKPPKDRDSKPPKDRDGDGPRNPDIEPKIPDLPADIGLREPMMAGRPGWGTSVRA